MDDVLGATICREDGIADPAGVTRELVRRAAAAGVEVRERTDALALDADVARGRLRRARRRSRPARGVELPVRPLVRQLADVGPVAGLPVDLPMTIEENGFHFRRVGADVLRLAMGEPSCAGTGRQRCATTSSRTGAPAGAARYPQPRAHRVRARGPVSTT